MTETQRKLLADLHKVIVGELGDIFDVCKDCKLVANEHAAAERLHEQQCKLIDILRNDCDIDASWDGLRGFWNVGLTENGVLLRDRAVSAEAEVERLRGDVERMFGENVKKNNEIARLLDENERLRSCLSDDAENARLVMGEYKQLREENERLRERFDRFEYKMGCLLCDLTGGLISKAETTDNGAIAEVVYERLTQELEEENERLRQELAIRDESEQEKVIDYLSEQSVDWEDRYRALMSENAKLRKLLKRHHTATKAMWVRIKSEYPNGGFPDMGLIQGELFELGVLPYE